MSDERTIAQEDRRAKWLERQREEYGEAGLMTEKEKKLAERIIANPDCNMTNWRACRLLDYLLEREEEEPLGRPTEVEKALLRECLRLMDEVAEVQAKIDELKESWAEYSMAAESSHNCVCDCSLCALGDKIDERLERIAKEAEGGK